jgi:multidrug efflux pump
MSAALLRGGGEARGLAGVSGRAFERLKATYQRHLAVALGMRPVIYAAWVVVSLLAVVMFVMAPKELAPTEDQGEVFGVVNTPSNSTLDQVVRSTREVNRTVMELPEAAFTFQITLPSGGLWGLGL